MNIKQFRYRMIDFKFAVLNQDVILFKLKKGRWEVYDSEISTEYNTLDEAAEHICISGESVKELIEKLETIKLALEGGRGAGGDNQKFEWRSAGGGGGENKSDYAARMNNAIKVKTPEEAIAAFRRAHDNSDIEHAITVTSQGFVNSYVHGGASSVMPGRTLKGDLVVHNHPNKSSFSPADMLSTAASVNEHGIVATYGSGYRIFTKGNHFDAVGFTKAVNRATKRGIKGKDINDAVDRFLKRNQKKYGYVFKNVKD